MNNFEPIKNDNSEIVDYSISIIRTISLIFIIVCHFFQFFGNELAVWFNVGVQIFLIISGYLYGGKKISDLHIFYKNRIKRILIPYYIVLCILGLSQYLFATQEINIFLFLQGVICFKTLSGAGHLWFIPTILMCYLITPLLCFYRDRYIGTNISFWKFLSLSLIISFIFYGGFADFYNPAHVWCFILGFAIRINAEKRIVSKKLFYGTIIFIAICGNVMQILIDYVLMFDFRSELLDTILSIIRKYNHVFLGASLFVCFKYLFGKLKVNKYMILLLKQLDKINYECYLVHLPLILGPFSLMEITDNIFVNIVLIISIVLSASAIVKKLETIIGNFIHNITKDKK